MKKKARLLALSLLVIVLITGCRDENALVRERVEGFFKSMEEFDLEAMSGYILSSEADFNIDSLEEDNMTRIFMDYFKENSSKISYEIKDIVVNKKKAKVKLDLSYINGESLFKYSLGDLMEESFNLALLDSPPSDEELNSLVANILEENKGKIKEEYTSISEIIYLSKVDGTWYLDELDDVLLNAITSNFISSLNKMDQGLVKAEGGDIKTDDKDLIKKNIGEELDLSSFKIKVNTVEEVDETGLASKEKLRAEEGKKLLLLGLEITNTTNREFDYPEDIVLVDKESKEYKPYSSKGVKDGLLGRKLEPNKKESGVVCFELGAEVSGYSLVFKDEGKLYEIVLR